AALNDLGLVLRGQGRYAEAEALFRQSMEIDSSILDPNHPDMLRGMLNLASALNDEDKLVEAEVVLREALEMAPKLSSREDAVVAACLQNLGGLLMNQGKV